MCHSVTAGSPQHLLISYANAPTVNMNDVHSALSDHEEVHLQSPVQKTGFVAVTVKHRRERGEHAGGPKWCVANNRSMFTHPFLQTPRLYWKSKRLGFLQEMQEL